MNEVYEMDTYLTSDSPRQQRLGALLNIFIADIHVVILRVVVLVINVNRGQKTVEGKYRSRMIAEIEQ